VGVLIYLIGEGLIAGIQQFVNVIIARVLSKMNFELNAKMTIKPETGQI